MKFLVHLTTTLFLAITACGAKPDTKYRIEDLGTNGYAYMNNDCMTYSVIFAAHEIVTKLNGSPTTEKAANVTVRMGTIPGCGDNSGDSADNSSYIETLFEIKPPNLKNCLTKGATLSVKSLHGTRKKCSSWPEDLCDEDPLSVSFHVALTPTHNVFEDDSRTWDSTGNRIRSSSTIVKATSDISGTLIDGVPFTSDYSDEDISLYTTETI
jgi:hypothetical protein